MSRWVVIDVGDYDVSYLPRKPACYVIYLDDKIVYVGQSTNVRNRILGHGINLAHYSNLIKTPWGRFRNVKIKIKYSLKYGDWAMVELRLIRRLKPPENYTGYQRSESAKMVL